MNATTRGAYWLAKTSSERLLSSMILETLELRDISGWTVIFSRESSRLGYCDYRAKEICISRRVILTDWEEAVDTAMHEVAHAVAGAGAGHGIRWKSLAKELGAKPRAKAEGYVNLDQAGKLKTAKTSYGPVAVTVGEVVEVHGSIGKLKILELQRKHFIGESAMGTRHQLPIDFLHPNYGDAAKVPEKVVELKDRGGRSIKITLGKSYYTYRGVTYVAVEGRRRNVLAVSPTGERLLVPAELFVK